MDSRSRGRRWSILSIKLLALFYPLTLTGEHKAPLNSFWIPQNLYRQHVLSQNKKKEPCLKSITLASEPCPNLKPACNEFSVKRNNKLNSVYFTRSWSNLGNTLMGKIPCDLKLCPFSDLLRKKFIWFGKRPRNCSVCTLKPMFNREKSCVV